MRMASKNQPYFQTYFYFSFGFVCLTYGWICLSNSDSTMPEEIKLEYGYFYSHEKTHQRILDKNIFKKINFQSLHYFYLFLSETHLSEKASVILVFCLFCFHLPFSKLTFFTFHKCKVYLSLTWNVCMIPCSNI